MVNASLFFHTKDFIFRNSPTQIVSFEKENYSIFFSKKENKLISLPQSPFGGFLIGAKTEKNDLTSLLNEIILFARANQMRSIEIVNCPEVYNPEYSRLICGALLSTGFVLKYKDTAQVLRVDEEIQLKKMRKRALAKCQKAGYQFRALGVEKLPEAYNLFLQSRRNKNYPVTMNLPDLEKEFIRFPAQYSLYGVLNGEELIAACVVVKVNTEILYYFFPGDSLAYRKMSPCTLLIVELFETAKHDRFTWIDLGLCTDNGVLNQGLYDFKKSFGAVDSIKTTFELVL